MPLRRPRIGVDARHLLIARRTGVERMTYHFIEHLSAFTDCEFVLIFDHVPPVHLAVCERHEVVVERPRFGALRKLFDTWLVCQLPDVLRQHRIEAFVSLNTKFPLRAGIPSFTTVHGAEWFFYPKGYRLAERARQRLWFELSCRYSAGIITFSENTRSDILKIRPSCRAPMCVVPEGCDPIFRKLEADQVDASVLQRHRIKKPYILSVCSLVPRKNIDGLLLAFAGLVRERHLAHVLVLVGKSGWKAQDLHRLAADLGISDRVLFLGFVPDEDLVQLYNQAALFVYPSKYEGFGLPLLEAMSCGVAVVTSNRSATAEVAGEAAILIDPHSVASLAGGITRALSDETLRAGLVRAGHAHVLEYSWPRMASTMCEFIRARVPASASAGIA